MSETVPQGVGWTALVVAAQRAAESRRDDALFHDPLAERLTEQVGEGPGAETPGARLDDQGNLTPLARMMGDYLPVRTRFFDDFLLGATAEGVDQVVLLAAGLDGRAYRLPWPDGTTLFEIDTPEVLAFAERLATGLTPTADRRGVAVDLREDWPAALTATGFDPSRPAAWLAEGLLVYLPADAADLLLRRVGELSVPGSRLATEYSAGDPAASTEAAPEQAQGDPGVELFRDLVDEGPPAPPDEWFTRHGWTSTVRTLPQVAADVGRDAPAIMDEDRGGTRCWLVDARR